MTGLHGRRRLRCLATLVVVVFAGAALPGGAAADQASQPSAPVAASIATGNLHSCALVSAMVRCWGYGGDGALGYGTTASIGDNDAPDAAGPVDVGAGRTVKAISSGSFHTCALLDNDAVRCWGFGSDGRLGYGNTNTVGDDETPGSVGTVDLGAGRTAKAISAGNGHTCALLDNDAVRCWGFNLDGRLGYGHTDSIGDNEVPGAAGPVNLGAGRTAKAITSGGFHTCALLDNDTVRCWGFGGAGRLGYGNTTDVGRTPATTPDTVGPVFLGTGRTAKAITAGFGHTCVVLDDDNVRCWGFHGSGRLGYGNANSIGDNELPGTGAPVDLGAGRTARAIDAGEEHTCAMLDDGSARCWGWAAFGQLGYGNDSSIGDNELPGSVAPVSLGSGRTAIAISLGGVHTCARLDDQSVRCWGSGANGRLGYCDQVTIGDNELPSSAGPVALGQPGIAGDGCPVSAQPPPPPPPPPPVPSPDTPATVVPVPVGPDALAAALAAQRERTAALRACHAAATTTLSADRRKMRALSAARRRTALRRAGQRAVAGRKACLKRHGRTPGRVSTLAARGAGAGRIDLTFQAVGTDGSQLPAARRYVIKQSTRPIRTARDFARAPALCKGRCSFNVTGVGDRIILRVTSLRRRVLHYYAVVAQDNVSGRRGLRSTTISARAG